MVSARHIMTEESATASARRMVRKLRRHPMMCARAFNAGRAHFMRDKLMQRAREMKATGDYDVGEVVLAARMCNRIAVWFLQSLKGRGE